MIQPPETALDHALYLAKLGLKIFPIARGTKRPVKGLKWKDESTDDEMKIMGWAAIHPDCNWAIDCGKSGLIAMDFDTKDGKAGFEERDMLDLEYGLPHTLVIKTPNDGEHRFYWGKCKSGTDITGSGSGFDIKSEGGYVVAAGSVLAEGSYEIVTNGSIAKIDEGMLEYIEGGVGKVAEGSNSDNMTPAVDLDLAHHIADATEYLLKVEEAVEGSGGDDRTYKVAVAVRDFGISEGMCFDLMMRFWNDRCSPPWSYGELKKKVANAYRYALDRPGGSTAEADFDIVKGTSEAERVKEVDKPLGLDAFSGPPPKRKWIIENWLPEGKTTSLYGTGGVGKSKLAMQLGYSIASGIPFLGMEVKKMPVLMIMCEDDKDELHNRIAEIRSAPEYEFAEEEEVNILFWTRVGLESAIGEARQSSVVKTKFYKKLVKQLNAMGSRDEPKLLVLDTLTDVYAGSEIIRELVNAFVKVVVGGINKECGATTLLIGHPSKGGGDYSGSTHWNNAVRHRLVLELYDENDKNLKRYKKFRIAKANTGDDGLSLLLHFNEKLYYETVDVSGIVDEQGESDKDILMEAILKAAEKGEQLGGPRAVVGRRIHEQGIKGGNGEVLDKDRIYRLLGEMEREGDIKVLTGKTRINGYWPVDLAPC